MQTATEVFMGLTEAFGRCKECQITVEQANKIAVACARAANAWNDAENEQFDEGIAVGEALRLFNDVIHGYGIEFLKPSELPDSEYRFSTRDYVDYVNRGDTYTTTLLFDYCRGEFYATSWGEYMEKLEQEAYT